MLAKLQCHEPCWNFTKQYINTLYRRDSRFFFFTTFIVYIFVNSRLITNQQKCKHSKKKISVRNCNNSPAKKKAAAWIGLLHR